MSERDSLAAQLRAQATTWREGRYGDQGLRLRAERTAALQETAADRLDTLEHNHEGCKAYVQALVDANAKFREDLAACQRELAHERHEKETVADAAKAHTDWSRLDRETIKLRAEAAEAERDKLRFNLGRMAATDTREDRFAIIREITQA